jgi:hypothetical protein
MKHVFPWLISPGGRWVDCSAASLSLRSLYLSWGVFALPMKGVSDQDRSQFVSSLRGRQHFEAGSETSGSTSLPLRPLHRAAITSLFCLHPRPKFVLVDGSGIYKHQIERFSSQKLVCTSSHPNK